MHLPSWFPGQGRIRPAVLTDVHKLTAEQLAEAGLQLVGPEHATLGVIPSHPGLDVKDLYDNLTQTDLLSKNLTQSSKLDASAKAGESKMANKFIGLLEAIGKDFAKGLTYAVQYAVPVEKLVGLLFPGALPVATEVSDATSLIQNAVLLVEQKYAASGVQNGTGIQKSAEVLTLVTQTVTGLLTKAGHEVDADYLQGLINAVVAILNVQPAPAVKTA